MKADKTVDLHIRIHPNKREALQALAEKQRLRSVAALVMPLIDQLLDGNVRDNTELLEIDSEWQSEETNPLSMRLSFRPLPGDEQHLNRYAAARSIKPSVVMKLVLRAWLSHNAPLPKNELALLGITSNQLAAIGRNLNQLIKLAHTGDCPLAKELTALLQETLILTRRASQEIDAIVKTNLTSWESDYAKTHRSGSTR